MSDESALLELASHIQPVAARTVLLAQRRELEKLRDLVALATEFRIPGSRITVQWRGKHDWCVFEGGTVLNKAGDWEYEPLPSSRSEEFTAHTRFDRDTAIRLAKEKANEFERANRR